MKTFEQILGKENPLITSLEVRGFKEPTEIQEKSIPEILKGKDVIAGASTGSGKTLAFAAGILNNVKKGHGIQGLVLTPTRELAEQVSRELTNFSKHLGLRVISVYGGVSIRTQMEGIRTAEIVVGTPGRILDHLERRSISFSEVNTLVLDEADHMLDMGFIDDVEKIIKECPKKRQTLLFSATIWGGVSELAKKYMKDAIEISAELLVDPKKLAQVYYDVEDGLKYSLLKHLLQNERAKLVMIFCNTRRNVDFVSRNLGLMEVETVPIHGGFSQEKRNRMLDAFHSSKVHVLVATDVAARGLDIPGVSHIYNFDIPKTIKEYTHRIGRTARAGKEGKVINLLASRDYDNFKVILRGEFDIAEEKTPYVEKCMLKWLPERKGYGGRGRGSRSYGGGRGGSTNRRTRTGQSYGGRSSSGGSRSYGGRSSGRSSSRGPSKSYGGSRSSGSYGGRGGSTNRRTRTGQSYGGRNEGSTGGGYAGDSRSYDSDDSGTSGGSRRARSYGKKSRDDKDSKSSYGKRTFGRSSKSQSGKKGGSRNYGKKRDSRTHKPKKRY